VLRHSARHATVRYGAMRCRVDTGSGAARHRTAPYPATRGAVPYRFRCERSLQLRGLCSLSLSLPSGSLRKHTAIQLALSKARTHAANGKWIPNFPLSARLISGVFVFLLFILCCDLKIHVYFFRQRMARAQVLPRCSLIHGIMSKVDDCRLKLN